MLSLRPGSRERAQAWWLRSPAASPTTKLRSTDPIVLAVRTDVQLGGIADIDRADDVVGGVHQADDGVDEIIDIAERAGRLHRR